MSTHLEVTINDVTDGFNASGEERRALGEEIRTQRRNRADKMLSALEDSAQQYGTDTHHFRFDGSEDVLYVIHDSGCFKYRMRWSERLELDDLTREMAVQMLVFP